MTVGMYTTVISAIRHTVQQVLLSIQQDDHVHVKAGSLLSVALPIRAVLAGPTEAVPIEAGPIACTCIGLPSGNIV